MLCERLGLRRDPAYDPVWSAAPDFLGLIADHVLAQTPGTIVECSSGASTLILARCCELNGQGKVFSLENSALYANKTRSELAACGLEQYAEIIHAPLVQQSIDGSQYQWYDLKNFTASRIDMLVIDGPPGFVQRHARFPALPLLFDRLADGGKVYLDDAARVDEQEIVSMWRTQFSSVEHEYAATERGCAILRIRR
jgi:predicted O-methyltransferase YrrM